MIHAFKLFTKDLCDFVKPLTEGLGASVPGEWKAVSPRHTERP